MRYNIIKEVTYYDVKILTITGEKTVRVLNPEYAKMRSEIISEIQDDNFLIKECAEVTKKLCLPVKDFIKYAKEVKP